MKGDLDEMYGAGFTGKVVSALLKLNQEEHGEILELFSTEGFIETDNANYSEIEDVARQLGLIE